MYKIQFAYKLTVNINEIAIFLLKRVSYTEKLVVLCIMIMGKNNCKLNTKKYVRSIMARFARYTYRIICHTFSTNDDVSKFTIHTVLLNCNNTYCTYTLLNILSRLTFYFGKKVYESINSNCFSRTFFFSPLPIESHSIVFFFYKKIRIKFWPFTGSMNVHSLASIKVISKSLQNFHSFIATSLLSFIL